MDKNERAADKKADVIEAQPSSATVSVKRRQPHIIWKGVSSDSNESRQITRTIVREALNLLLAKEHNRTDKLLMAYTRLKTRYEELMRVHADQDRQDSDVTET